MYKAIVAMSLNRVIGVSNQLPWYLPEDLRFFKKMTTGNTVVMGRKTYLSIGRPLPNRLTVVLSRREDQFQAPEGVIVLHSIEDLKTITPQGDIFICGGGEIYRQLLPQVDELYVTLVKKEISDGDVFFPPFEDQFELWEILEETSVYRIARYLRGQNY